MRRGLLSVLLPFAVLTSAPWAGADIFSYVDKDGTVHFTNNPGGDRRYKLYMRGGKDGVRVRGADSLRGSSVAPSDTSAERFSRYDPYIREAAVLYQIPEELVRAVIKVESDYDPRAISRTGAQGLMQLMPDTAERMQVRDIFDPRENILGGTRYLRVLANMFNGDLTLTLAGYNAGENAVMRFGGLPPYDETSDYVVHVLAYYRRYREIRDVVTASSGVEG